LLLANAKSKFQAAEVLNDPRFCRHFDARIVKGSGKEGSRSVKQENLRDSSAYKLLATRLVREVWKQPSFSNADMCSPLLIVSRNCISLDSAMMSTRRSGGQHGCKGHHMVKEASHDIFQDRASTSSTVKSKSISAKRIHQNKYFLIIPAPSPPGRRSRAGSRSLPTTTTSSPPSATRR